MNAASLPRSESSPRPEGSSTCRHAPTTAGTDGGADARRRSPRDGSRPRRVGRWSTLGGIIAAVLLATAALLVGWEVLERRLIPDPSTGWRHFLITMRALVITGVGCSIVYAIMRRQQNRVADTARRLAGFVQAYMADPSTEAGFANPTLRHCRDVFDCEASECEMFNRRGDRCWQVVARTADPGTAPHTFATCRECEVYRSSTVDEYTALGEEINQLLFLLRTEAQRSEDLRARMVDREKLFAIGQLASGIAHEVGNPLASISSIVQALNREAKGTETSAASLAEIQSHVDRISATLQDLSSLARARGDQPGVVNVGRALEEAARLIGFDERARQVEIERRIEESLPAISGVPGQIEQVLLHLTQNALDAMPTGGTLTVGARAVEDAVEVSIQDTGAGIPEDARPHVFHPFFTTKEPGRGTGLGLAVSYAIVQQHGGELAFESTVGKGTVFTLRLPIMGRVKIPRDASRDRR